MPPKSPTLYKLAADRRYERIPERVEAHPADLQWTDSYGSTALHILCQARNIDSNLLQAVDAILQRAPDLVLWANVATWTPLHFAVERRLLWGGDEDILADGSYNSNSTTELILQLLRACPEAVSVRTRSGYKTRTPFHIACEAAADYKVLKAMLSINPSLATEPLAQERDVYTVTENPLQLLWKAHLHHSALSSSSSSSSNAATTRRHFWNAERKMALLLQAAHCGTVVSVPRSPSFSLLHAACSVRTPREYFTRILTQYQDQVSVPDTNGRYALHFAVSSASADSLVYTQYVLEALIKVHAPAAAARDPSGRLPLHLALERTCMTWHKGGIKSLTYANVNALRQPDPVTGLVPFLASAQAALKSRLHLSTTYELLRLAPDVAQTLCQSQQEDDSSTDEDTTQAEDEDEEEALLESLR